METPEKPAMPSPADHVRSTRAGDGRGALKYHYTKTRSNYHGGNLYDRDRALSESDKLVHLLRDLMHAAEADGIDFTEALSKAVTCKANLRRADEL